METGVSSFLDGEIGFHALGLISKEIVENGNGIKI
jgi:hypothetical protein